MRLIAILAIGFSALATPATAREPRLLAASSPWVVDYANDSCRLVRKFGEGSDAVTATFDQLRPGDEFFLTLVGAPLKPTGSDPAFIIRFGPGEADQSVRLQSGITGGQPAVLSSRLRLVARDDARSPVASATAVPAEQPSSPSVGNAREKAVTWVELRGKSIAGDLRMATGPMDKPFEALRACGWDMVKGWGLDPAQQQARSRPPVRTENSPLLRTEDYPSRMWQKNVEAIIHFRLMVDATGKVESCHIQLSTRPKDFDDAICRRVLKARFHPALDANGRPMRSFWVQTVYFKMA